MPPAAHPLPQTTAQCESSAGSRSITKPQPPAMPTLRQDYFKGGDCGQGWVTPGDSASISSKALARFQVPACSWCDVLTLVFQAPGQSKACRGS